MKNPFEKRKSRGPKASRLLEIDAWIDSTLYEAQFSAAETWENITIFFRRFRATGWRRAPLAPSVHQLSTFLRVTAARK